MRRLLRILFNAATVLSLVLCVGAIAAWVRSYRACDVIWWSLAKPRFELSITMYREGLLAGVATPVVVGPVSHLLKPGAAWQQSATLSYFETYAYHGTFFNKFGFAFDSFVRYPAAEQRYLVCPYWFIMLLTAILPGARLAGWRRRARRLRMRPGLCQHCGYDCRATPDRCPECGREAAAAAAKDVPR